MISALLVFHHHITDYFCSQLAIQTLYFEGAVAYKLGLPSPGFNWVYVQDSKWESQEILSQCQSFFDKDGLGFSVIVPSFSGGGDLETFFKDRNYRQYGQTKTMSCDLAQDLAHDLEQETCLLEKETISLMNNNLAQWVSPLISAFENTEELSTLYAQVHAYALEKGAHMRHFTLFVGSIPVSSLTLTINEGLGRIDDVGTLRDYQGQGFATKLIHYALSEAKKQGVDYCFLEASSAGLKLYEKMGFVTIEENHIFDKDFY